MSRFLYVLYGLAVIAIFTFANVQAANDDDGHYNSSGRGGSFSGGHK